MVEIAFSMGFGLLCMTIVGQPNGATGEDYERVQASINETGIGTKSYAHPLISFHCNDHLVDSKKFRYLPHCLFAHKDIGKLTYSVNSVIAGIPNNHVFPEESKG